MKTNISILNRIVRSLIGAALIIAALVAFAKINIILLVIGAILVLTGLIGFCPIDHYFHLKQLP